MENCKEKSISKILSFILELQRNAECPMLNGGCDKPCLGPNIDQALIFNTRPVTLYCCCPSANVLWSMPFVLNNIAGESTVFKIEKVDGNCATFEVLAPNPDTSNPLIPYVSTNSFFTINLDCVLAISCLADTYTA